MENYSEVKTNKWNEQVLKIIQKGKRVANKGPPHLSKLRSSQFPLLNSSDSLLNIHMESGSSATEKNSKFQSWLLVVLNLSSLKNLITTLTRQKLKDSFMYD